jgi:hypothetical protein
MCVDTKSPEFRQALAELYKYMAEKLSLKEVPRVLLVDDKKNAELLLGGTGSYDNKNKVIRLNVSGRWNKDILRTLAHELVHHHQNERGDLQSIGNSSESSQDPQYAQNDPHLRKMEIEAYAKGNMLFRDWADSKKYGNK